MYGVEIKKKKDLQKVEEQVIYYINWIEGGGCFLSFDTGSFKYAAFGNNQSGLSNGTCYVTI